jgi:cellulose synthase/poly-beta-1,6-N-acetylglucosamine synthase-like glycosyltransferase
MALMLLLFLGTASVLWFSIFGYVLILGFIALFKRRVEGVASSCPEIAVVIPTLNEEDLVLKKLADLRRTDYPLERVSLVVVDGGSSDRTTELVRAEIARGEDIELVCLNGTKGNAYQVRNILTRLNHEFVVVTDVDSVLEPSCIRELIGVLEADPLTAVVGAQVQPHTRFLEEIIHWWVLNCIWWLEGEAASATGVSGVCYALRRSAVLPLCEEARALDVNLALSASARGWRTRICRRAKAKETRVPQNSREFLTFRRRRGANYLYELRSLLVGAHPPWGWRVTYYMRLWHFLAVPVLCALLAVLTCLMVGTTYWIVPVMTAFAFALPAHMALYASRTLSSEGRRWLRLSLALGRLSVLTLLSLVLSNYQALANAEVRS